ncbi:glycosyltransferase family 2 protein [Salipiger mucosus]|uniref:Putative glycosyl transferase n=1 Tax=Salipiger mucosus DSM 16094 TaxID=1123237 RepID=S9QWH1_9RHOB|nr:glycosyltransferase [Salipiger mucosus]EPX85731.1 putative glycosyl transferase [Salipiger mucosus DSM 16094]
MTEAPEISIIVNNYNYARFLPEALDSALAQREVTAEVVVVDDGSTDGSREVIEGYGDRIRARFQPNGGQARAINAGVAMARAPILAFLDADDRWHPDKLSAVREAFDASPEAGLVYHRLQPVHSDGTHAFAAIPRSLCNGDLGPRLLRSGGRWPFAMTSSLAVRRSLWLEAGDIPAEFTISADAWIAGVLPFLAPVVALPEALGYYRIHDNTWFRHHDDAAMLARRMTHWEETARVTNAFLAERGMPGRLRLRDHFDYRVAQARLGREDAPGMLALALHGLTDAGEPSAVRRLRDTLFALRNLQRDRAEGALPADVR